MKPCGKNRKLIAWLATGALEAERSQELRAHLDQCEGCRGYLEEISRVTERLAVVETREEAQASESFHRRVLSRVRAEETNANWQTLVAHLRSAVLNWRIAALAVVAMALTIAVLFVVAGRRPTPMPELPHVPAVMAASATKDVSPSLSNYRLAASQSLEKLDELLTRQGNQAGWAGPVYTAGMLEAE